MSTTESQSVPGTAAAALAESLARAGIKIAFTVPGESLVGLLESLNASKIRIVTTRHEGAAAFMAGAVAQLTGRPTLVLAGRAPGAANLAIGLHAAQADSAPVVAIVGQVRREVRGREAFQEMDLTRAFEPMVKWSAEAREAAEIPGLGQKAVSMSLRGRPGPVLLAIPEDLMNVELPGTAAHAASPDHQAEPDPSMVRKVLRLLLDAERPLILAGAGVLRARSTDALVRFAETVQIPVISSWRRGDVFPNHHNLYLGMTGLGSPACVRERFERADALLVLGCRLGEMTTYGYSLPAETTRWALVDAEPHTVSGGHRPEIVMAADVAAFLRTAQRVLSNAALDAAGFDARVQRNSEDREAFDTAAVVGTEPWEGPGIDPGKVVATLGRVLPPEAIITTDAGDFGTWAARGYRFRRPGTFLGTTSGAMGYGLPAAIGASLARPGRLGVALAGDGGFAMTMAELETAVRERAHVIALVFDNGRYGTIWRHQTRQGIEPGLATTLGAMDFAAIADACGALGLAVRSDEEFEPALRQAIEAGRPAVLHLSLDAHWTIPDQTGRPTEFEVEVETPAESAEPAPEPVVEEDEPATESEVSTEVEPTEVEEPGATEEPVSTEEAEVEPTAAEEPAPTAEPEAAEESTAAEEPEVEPTAAEGPPSAGEPEVEPATTETAEEPASEVLTE